LFALQGERAIYSRSEQNRCQKGIFEKKGVPKTRNEERRFDCALDGTTGKNKSKKKKGRTRYVAVRESWVLGVGVRKIKGGGGIPLLLS